MINTIKKFKKTIGIKTEILGIFYSSKLPSTAKNFRDTACTALARSFFTKEAVFFNAKKYPQLCSGASYFLKLAPISDKETIDVYINKEKVFENKNICKKFLKNLPKFPESLKNKFIVIKPIGDKDKPSVVVLLVDPAQAGRILGLINRDKYEKTEILPSQPTCLAFFAPLVTKKPHINFLDYYDRYYQGRVNGKNIWPEDKMLLSMSYKDFTNILKDIEKSPHGLFKPDLTPQRITKM
ncbi:MAG: DUF169 domain-containing protein [Candidatus Staskawiczbacteria bacterium]|nr:DUF169 domain-containing protein [Candidatus Staskawiczbacteria bacterium]